MIALTSPYLWYTTRATGLVVLVLFTMVVALGALVANRVGGSTVGRFELNEIHRTVSSVAIVFLGIHILTTVVDSFVSTGVLSAVIPFISSYKRVPVALGTIAFDLMIAVWISSLAKTRIANSSWRFIHWFSWMAYAVAVIHAFLTGTDSRHGIGFVVVLASAAIGAGAGVWRFAARPARAAGRTALSPLGAVVEPERQPNRVVSRPRIEPDAVPPSARRRDASRPAADNARRDVAGGAARPTETGGVFPRGARPSRRGRR